MSSIKNLVDSEVKKDQIMKESFIADVMRMKDALTGSLIGAVGLGGIGAAATSILFAVCYILGLTNPVLAFGLSFLTIVKYSIVGGLFVGGYHGFQGTLYEAEGDNIIRKEFLKLSKEAIAAVKKRDEYLVDASKDMDRNGIRNVMKDSTYTQHTRNIIMKFSEVNNFVNRNKNEFNKEETKALKAILNLGLKGKITYLDIKKK